MTERLDNPLETPEGHLEAYTVSISGYTRGCRCDGCRKAHTDYTRERRSKQPAPAHGTISRYNSKKDKCRCDLCTAAQRTYQQERRKKKRVAEGLPVFAPRPPGMVWLDSSDFSHVVRCERCDKNYGTWVDKSEAERFQDSHRYMHELRKETIDWSKWSEERLIKHPGGRPLQDEKPMCTDELCTEDAHARGLCMKHYKRALRANALPEEVIDPLEYAHGFASTYTNYGCRCDACKAAQSVNWKKQYQRMKAAKAGAS